MVYEITLRFEGKKSGKDISRPVWFVHEDNNLHICFQFMFLEPTGKRTY
jgi:hypothetical protein